MHAPSSSSARTRPLPVVADVDTGVDDALALLFLSAHPGIDLRAVTCVAGNAALDQVVQNTLDVLAVAGSDAPVAPGAQRPLLEPARDASAYHGANGLGGIRLPTSPRSAESTHAVDLIRRAVADSDDPVTLLCLAPLTNVALFLRLYPDEARRLERIVVMGGTSAVGNASPVAEFNVWHDPEAARIVLDSEVPTTLYPLDVFSRVVVSASQVDALDSQVDALGTDAGADAASPTRVASLPGTPAALAARLLRHQISLADLPDDVASGAKIGDAGTACMLVAPELFGLTEHPIEVALSPGPARGQTVIDRRRRTGEADEHGRTAPGRTSRVALTVDAPATAALFVDTLLDDRAPEDNAPEDRAPEDAAPTDAGHRL